MTESCCSRSTDRRPNQLTDREANERCKSRNTTIPPTQPYVLPGPVNAKHGADSDQRTARDNPCCTELLCALPKLTADALLTAWLSFAVSEAASLV